MNTSLVSLLWVIGNVVGSEIDSGLKFGTLAWILFLYNFWKMVFNREYFPIKAGKLDDYYGSPILRRGKIDSIKFFISTHKFEILYSVGTILTQLDSSGGWRFYDSALLYLISFGSPKTTFHPLFFAIICMSFGISIWFILLEPILYVLWHIFITGVQSASFSFFTKKESLIKLATGLFFCCCFFKHAIIFIPQQDKYYESDSIIEELLTLNIPVLTLLPAAFELFFLVKSCTVLNLQELFLSFVLAEVLKFIQIQRFSLLLSVVWLLVIAMYSRQSAGHFDLEDAEQSQAISRKGLGVVFVLLVISSVIFSYQVLPDEDRQQKYRYHFVKSVEDHFKSGKEWSIKVDHPKNLFIGNMNHFVHTANQHTIYFEHLDSVNCESSVIILPPNLKGCSCGNLKACSQTQASYNGFYPVLRSESSRWHLDDPCEIPLMFDGIQSNVFQNRTLIRNEKVVRTTNILNSLSGCFDSQIYLISETVAANQSLTSCRDKCDSTSSCVSYTLNEDSCTLYNSIPKTKKCAGESGILVDKYKCERIK